MILVTGTGRAGSSWGIRGEQLGQAIGASVVAFATTEDCRRADLIVVVKRTGRGILESVRASGRPWVWDIVDAWPQAQGRELDERHARRWLRNELSRLQPHAVVFPTARMQADADWQGPQTVIYHHAWPRYKPRPIKPAVQVVGYEGGRHYLGRWARILQEQCDSRGWRFEINGNLAAADIGVALRDCGGYPARHWKSNCKLANLQALGIPALCSPEAGYRETATGAECWIETPEQLVSALDALAERERRTAARRLAQTAPVQLDAVASGYRDWLCTL